MSNKERLSAVLAELAERDRKKGLARVRAARVRGRPVAETLLEDRR